MKPDQSERRIRVTHRYHFYASHRLHSPALTDAENDAVYGKCNNPFGHGHNYVLEVTIEGIPDVNSGLILNRRQVDETVREKVLKLFDHRNINKDVPEFATLVPTTENVAIVIARILEGAFSGLFPSGSSRLVRVHVQETDRNGFEVFVGREQAKRVSMAEPLAATERVLV